MAMSDPNLRRRILARRAHFVAAAIVTVDCTPRESQVPIEIVVGNGDASVPLADASDPNVIPPQVCLSPVQPPVDDAGPPPLPCLSPVATPQDAGPPPQPCLKPMPPPQDAGPPPQPCLSPKPPPKPPKPTICLSMDFQ